MTVARAEQRNPYKGSPPRPWVRLLLRAADGSVEEVQLLADTGNPYGVIVGAAVMRRFMRGRAPGLVTNFGPLAGGWTQVVVPELAFDRDVLGYGSDAVVTAARNSSPDFDGLAGLPLLRMMEYGGDAGWFWIRPAPRVP